MRKEKRDKENERKGKINLDREKERRKEESNSRLLQNFEHHTIISYENVVIIYHNFNSSSTCCTNQCKCLYD
jgi:hypothetical protein